MNTSLLWQLIKNTIEFIRTMIVAAYNGIRSSRELTIAAIIILVITFVGILLRIIKHFRK